MTRRLVLLLLFVLPVVIVPIGATPFENGKVILFLLGAEMLLLVALVVRGSVLYRPTELGGFWPLGVLFLLTFVPLVGQIDRQTWLGGNSYRLQGALFWWHLLVFSVLAAGVRIPSRSGILLAAEIGWLAFFAFFVGRNPAGRLIGSLGEPNSLAAALVFFWPYVAAAKLKNGWFWVRPAALIVAGGVILLSGSRSALVAAAGQGIAYLGRVWGWRPILRLGVVVAFLITSLFLVGVSRGGVWENRSELWRTALTAGADNVVFGRGPASQAESLGRAAWRLGNNLRFESFDSAHNLFLDFWLEYGLIGLVVLGYLLVTAWGALDRTGDTASQIALVGLVLALQFNPAGVVSLVGLFWLIGRGRIVGVKPVIDSQRASCYAENG